MNVKQTDKESLRNKQVMIKKQEIKMKIVWKKRTEEENDESNYEAEQIIVDLQDETQHEKWWRM